jgi:hypothetical protein
MRRPPDRKLVLAVTILVVAACMTLSRTAVGTDRPAAAALMVKLFGRS